jgi:Uma2 family endonuclease
MSHTAERLHTVEELPDIPDCYELVDGELIMMMSPAGPPHGYIVMKLAIALGVHIETRKLGVVFGEQTGFILTRNPDTVRAPDIAFIREDRVPAEGFGAEYFDGAPDLVVEILSPSNRPAAMRRKIDQYLAAGTQLVWIIDPGKRTIAVHSPLRAVVTLQETDALDGEDVVPGFQYEIAQLFVLMQRG